MEDIISTLLVGGAIGGIVTLGVYIPNRIIDNLSRKNPENKLLKSENFRKSMIAVSLLILAFVLPLLILSLTALNR